MIAQSKTACCALLAVVPLALPSCTTTERLVTGLTDPLFVTAPVGDVSRIFILERGGKIKSFDLGTKLTTTYLDITSLVQSGSEQGLLGLAFSPNYGADGKFYVNYTAKPDGATKVVQYQRSTVNPNVADPTTAVQVISFAQPQANHNGGWIGFDDDGYLYIATGDGGGGYDDDDGHTPDIGNAQDIDNNWLGKILRIYPFEDSFPADATRNYGVPLDNPFFGVAGDDEIWAYGLRNPWRCSFDSQTGDFWIGDVGQGTRKEIDFQPYTSNGGENYGWRLREGTIETPSDGIGGPPPPNNVEPIYDYSHGFGSFQGNSVTGGYVYRGPIADIRGKYFFADYVTKKIWSLTRSGTTFTDLTDWTSEFKPSSGSIDDIASFGEDSVGNLYIVDLDGEVYKVISQGIATTTARRAMSSVGRLVGGRK